MSVKKSSGSILSVIILTGLLFFIIALFCFVFRVAFKKKFIQPLKNTVSATTQGSTKYGMPVYLKIPSIGVDTSVEPVGLTSGGAMDVAKDRNNVGWFSSGTRPGEIGSAVIDGHYGTWKNGQATVFNDLSKLHPGDKLSVEDDNGVIISFVVRKTQIYDPQADASAIFSSNDGLSHLNLITCEGVWDQDAKTYSGRLVIFSDEI